MPKSSVVLLHGWNLFGEKYRQLSHLFKAKGFNFLAPDLPGFGKNRKLTKALTLDDYVEFVSQYLEDNSIKKTVLIGHSFGGRVALKFAVKYPQKVTRLILTGTPGFLPVNHFKVISFLILSKTGNVMFLLPPFVHFKSLAKKVLYRLAKSSDYYHATGFLKETFKTIIHEDLVSSMEKITIPTVLVWGEKDTLVPVSIAHKMKKTLKDCQLVILTAATHKLPYNEPEKFFKAVGGYLL